MSTNTNPHTINLKSPEEAVAWAELVVQVCTYAVNTIGQEHGREAALHTAMNLDPWVQRTEERVKQVLEGTK